MELGEEEKRQLKKIIEQTGYIPPGLKDHAIAKKLLYKKAGPVLLVLQDEKKDKKDFELISVRKKTGLLGEELEVPLTNIIQLGRRSIYSSWIVEVNDDKELIFPYYHGDTSKIIFSPTFFLIKNNTYQADKVGPYNVPYAGFLFLYNPKTAKNYLEAVSGSVVATVAVIENVMERHNESYSRKNHILNWIAFLLSKDSKNIVSQAFNMHTSFSSQYKKYVESLNKEK